MSWLIYVFFSIGPNGDYGSLASSLIGVIFKIINPTKHNHNINSQMDNTYWELRNERLTYKELLN